MLPGAQKDQGNISPDGELRRDLIAGVQWRLPPDTAAIPYRF